MRPPHSILAHKKYSVSTNLNAQQQLQQISANNSGVSQPSNATHHQQSSQSAIISKSESNNKLRRISNMKQKTDKSSSNAIDRRNQGLILATSATTNN